MHRHCLHAVFLCTSPVVSQRTRGGKRQWTSENARREEAGRLFDLVCTSAPLCFPVESCVRDCAALPICSLRCPCACFVFFPVCSSVPLFLKRQWISGRNLRESRLDDCLFSYQLHLCALVHLCLQKDPEHSYALCHENIPATYDFKIRGETLSKLLGFAFEDCRS